MKRPIVVTILSIVVFLAGLFQALIGGISLAGHNDEQFLADAQASTSEVTGLDTAPLLVGAVSLLVAGGPWQAGRISALGQRWPRSARSPSTLACSSRASSSRPASA
jgi:hypothetical protein